MQASNTQFIPTPKSSEDYAKRAELILDALSVKTRLHDAGPLATLLYTEDESPTQTPEPTCSSRIPSYEFTISGLDFEYSQEVDTALYEARAVLSPILAEMCPLVTKKGRKPLPATDWVRNSTKNRAHMAVIGSLALQSELMQLAEDDKSMVLQRVYLMCCFGNEKILGELVKLIIFGVPSAVCAEPVESYAKFITLLVGMTLSNRHLSADNQSAAPATQIKQKSKKGSKSKQNKTGNRHKEQQKGGNVQSPEQDANIEMKGEQEHDHRPKAPGEGDETLLAYFVARAAYITWSADYLQREMQSSRLSDLLSVRHPIQKDNTANIPALRMLETVAEIIARETVMREVVEHKDRELVQEAFCSVPLSRNTDFEHCEDSAVGVSASAAQLRRQLEAFLNFDDIPCTKPNAFRDLMNGFSRGADEPEIFGYSQETRVLDSLRYVDTPLEVPSHVVSPRDSQLDMLQNQKAECGAGGEQGVRLLSEGAVVRVYGDLASTAARLRMWGELYKCFLETYMTKIGLRSYLFLLALPPGLRSEYGDQLVQRSCCKCFHELKVPTCTPVKYAFPEAKWKELQQADQAVADWFVKMGKDKL
ncbi:hypothetical protein QFC22_001943 [Naganishia vaughanmartiniae]|uniref:Uncharacterized protein n=1 Tax=Naganishia vaughanmartiniae TaxID=1424756 RepID=A0ACC2XEP5_9TREE|nr:hypothetical protein QFC22_001943 [Naganishia vaughanmartiniae]